MTFTMQPVLQEDSKTVDNKRYLFFVILGAGSEVGESVHVGAS